MGFIDTAVQRHRDAKLEALLIQWAREYGEGPADSLGYGSRNILEKLHVHAGWLPPPDPVRAPTRTEADKLEQLVAKMEAGDMWKHAKVLRIDYYRPNDAMDSRLTRLRKIGVSCSKLGYEQYLDTAKEFIRVNLWIKRR